MTIFDDKEHMVTRGLKKDLIVFLLVFMVLGLLFSLPSPWLLSPAPEELQPLSVEFILSPILSMFVFGLLVSIMIGKWVTFNLARKYKNQHVSQGVVFDNSNSILGYLGFNLGMSMVWALSFGGNFFCSIFVTVKDPKSVLFCDAIISSLSTFIVGTIIGLYSWLIYQVASIEKETNQKMLVQYDSTGPRPWVIIAVGLAVTSFLVDLALYEYFTLE